MLQGRVMTSWFKQYFIQDNCLFHEYKYMVLVGSDFEL